MTGPTGDAVLYGARCTDSTHPGHGTVYACNQGPHRLQGLAAGVPCYELVASHDGGVTWAAAPVPTLAEAKAKLEGRAWKREAERLRAKLEDWRQRIVAAEADLLNIRGALSPNGYEPVTPLALVPTVAPAVQWLVDELERTRDALAERTGEAVDAGEAERS